MTSLVLFLFDQPQASDYIGPMITHAEIVSALGIEALAGETGRAPIAVRRWLQRNQIPPQYWNAVVRLAKKRGWAKSYSLQALADFSEAQ